MSMYEDDDDYITYSSEEEDNYSDDSGYDSTGEESLILEDADEEGELEENTINDDNYIKNIGRYKEALLNSYSLGEISLNQYYMELSELELYEHTKRNVIILDDDNIDKVKKLRDDRDRYKESYLSGEISEETYYKNISKSIKQEDEICKDSKVNTGNKKPTSKLEPNRSIENILDEIIEKEEKEIKKLAKKNNITLLKPVAGSTDYQGDVEEYEKSKQHIINMYMPGYKLAYFSKNGTTEKKYIIDIPLSRTTILKNNSQDTGGIQLSTVDEKEYAEILDIRKLLNKLNRDELINCIKLNDGIIENSDYIGNLLDKYKNSPDIKIKLEDLKYKLIEMLKYSESNGGSNIFRNTLIFKINKINDYLESPDRLKYKDTSDIGERKLGRESLINFFLSLDKNGEDAAKALETYIYEQTINNIKQNGVDTIIIDRVKYSNLIANVKNVLSFYPELINEYITGNISPTHIVYYKAPIINIKDDFTKSDEFRLLTPDEKYSYIRRWVPETPEYDIYNKYFPDNFKEMINADKRYSLKTHLISIDKFPGDIVIDRILEQDIELNQWEKMKLDIEKIKESPPGHDINTWKYIKLNRKRYLLPSQKVFRISTDDRIKTKNVLRDILLKCGETSSPESLSYMIERAIMSKSRTDKEYNKWSKIVTDNFSKICSLVKKSGEKIDLSDTSDTGESDSYALVITEFIYKTGDINMVNNDKIDKFLNILKSKGDISIILKDLSEEELIIYSQLNIADTKTTLNVVSEPMVSEIEDRGLKSPADIFIRPVLSPYRLDKDDIFIDGQYISGGNFPFFIDMNGNENYKPGDIEYLEKIFNSQALRKISSLEDRYTNIMKKMNKLKLEQRNSSIINPPTIDNKKITQYPDSRPIIKYVIRPRLGVKSPGEVYYTSDKYIKQNVKKYPVDYDFTQKNYGVPYSYENGIPVYNDKLKTMKYNGDIILEGPAIFKSNEDDEYSKPLMSSYHIFVEYVDTYGNPVYFREGVSEKNVITKIESKIDTCGRFKLEDSCNDPLSFSIDGLKCKWDGINCKSVGETIKIPDRNEISDVWNYVPEDEDIKKLWTNALESAKQYIRDMTSGKNLGEEYLSELVADQTIKLKEYIDNITKNNKKYKAPIVNMPNEKTLLEILSNRPKKSFITENKEFLLLSIRNIVAEGNLRKLTLLEIDNIDIYDHPSLGIINIIGRDKIDDKDFILARGKSSQGEIIRIPIDEIVETDGATIKTKQMFVYISKTDKKYLDDPHKGFEWIIDEINYETQGKTSKVVNYIDTRVIIPTGVYNGTPVITRNDIDNAMKYLAFSRFMDISDRLVLIEPVNASQPSISFALANGISLLDDLFSKIIRKIDLSDIVNKYSDSLKIPVDKFYDFNSEPELKSYSSDKKEETDIIKRVGKQKLSLEKRKNSKKIISNKEQYTNRTVIRVPRIKDED